MDRLFMPTLHTFAMENVFTGSFGDFRFKVTPNVSKQGKEVDFGNSSLFAEFWHGKFCYEKSEMEGEETFALTEEGRLSMMQWLADHI